MSGELNRSGSQLSAPHQEVIDSAIELMASDFAMAAVLEDRVIRLTTAVPGSPHLAVLQCLGLASAAAPIGGAAHGPSGVAAAVWIGPELYIARWTGHSRWVSAFKFSSRARPDEYLREESGIPSHLGRGSWYNEVPDEVEEAFFTVGLLLDEPPFPVPKVVEKPKAEVQAKGPATPKASGSIHRAGRGQSGVDPAARTRQPRERPERTIPRKVAPATRVCPMCNMGKHPAQFVEGSEFCVDCR